MFVFYGFLEKYLEVLKIEVGVIDVFLIVLVMFLYYLEYKSFLYLISILLSIELYKSFLEGIEDGL